MSRVSLMWVATALWLVAFVASVIDGEIAQSLGWFTFVGGGTLIASGAAENNQRYGYVALGLFVVGVLILILDFVSS